MCDSRAPLTWLQAALFARILTSVDSHATEYDTIVAIIEVATDELHRIDTIGGGDAWAVAQWASVMLAPYGFEALPSNMNALREALEHPSPPYQ